MVFQFLKFNRKKILSLTCLIIKIPHREWLLLGFSTLNLSPMLYTVMSMRELLCGDYKKAKENKQKAASMRLLEVVFEAFPQCVLQLYIAGQSDRVDIPVAISIASSSISIVYGMIQGSMAGIARAKFQIGEHGCLATVTFLPWLLLHFIAFVPSLAFFASMTNHSSPWFLLLIAYFLVHVCSSAFFTFAIPLWGSKYFGCILEYRFVPVIQQIIFSCGAFYIATSWMVSVWSVHKGLRFSEIVPTFVHRDIFQFKSFQHWNITGNPKAQIQSWAICNTDQPLPTAFSGSMAKTVADMIPRFEKLVFEAVAPEFDMNYAFCLTDIAVPLYLLFVLSCGLLLVVHLFLVFCWSWIYKHCFLSVDDRCHRLIKRSARIKNKCHGILSQIDDLVVEISAKQDYANPTEDLLETSVHSFECRLTDALRKMERLGFRSRKNI